MSTLMALMRAFTIRLRMLGAIVVILCLFALVGGVAGYGGWTVQSVVQGFIGHSVPQLQHTAELRVHMAQVRLLERQMVIDFDNAAAVARHRQAWAGRVEAATGLLGTLSQAGTRADGSPAAQAQQRLGQYAAAAKPVLASIEEGVYSNPREADGLLVVAWPHLDAVDQAVTDIAAATHSEAARTQEAVSSTMRVATGAFAACLAMVVLVVGPLTLLNSVSITRPIAYACKVADAIARGDLSQSIRVDGSDEAGQLLKSLAHMQASLRRLVGEVQQGSAAIGSASTQIASGNQDLSGRTEQTAGSLQQAAGSLELLTGTVSQTAESARTADQLAHSASAAAEQGGAVVSQVVATMEDIQASSHRIANIIGTIDGIAFQTNILALNAAVEAARAGEQGRGFAVVAAEVRSLAQRSAGAAREIKALIGNSVDRIEAGTRLVRDAGASMERIVGGVRQVGDVIGEISTATAHQSQGLRQISEAVSGLDRMTQQNAAMVEESAAAAASLKEQASRLAGLVATFHITAQAARPAAVAQAVIARASAAPSPRTVMPAPRAARSAPATAPAASSDAWETF